MAEVRPELAQTITFDGRTFRLASTATVAYIERLEQAVLAYRVEARSWLESDYPPSYLAAMEKRMADEEALAQSILAKHETP